MADLLERSKRKRSTLRTLTTKLITKIENTLSEDTENLNELEEHLAALNEKTESLNVLDTEIENLIDTDLMEDELIASDEYREKCIRIASKIKRCLRIRESLNQSLTQNPTNNPNRDSILHESITSSHTAHAIKLPKLVIDRFSGDPKCWSEFWNSFEGSIDHNESLTKLEKMAYLKMYLSNQAMKVVSGFELSNENYDNCIRLLKDRFGRKDVIINSFMNKILNLESVKYSNNVRALRRLYDELEISIRNLDALQVTSGTYGHLLIPILLKLIPEDLVLEFNRKKESKDSVDVSELIAFLKCEIECREASSLVLDDRKTYQNPRSGQVTSENKQFMKGIPTATAFTTQMTSSLCIFCSASHDSFKCRMSPQSKIEKLRAERRCYKCFKPFHNSKFCRSNKFPCFKCKSQTHHGSVCLGNRANFAKINETNSKAKEGESPNLNCNTNENQVLYTPTNSEILGSQSQSGLTCTKNNVYLQMCTAVASSNGKSKFTRIILDNGSQRSFITESLAIALELKPIRKESLSVYTFGSKTATEKIYPVVRVQMNKRNENKISVECYVTERISGAVPPFPSEVITRFLKINKLEIADDCEGKELRVEILIGADYVWDIILNERIFIDKNLSAIKTIFGWVIAGTDVKEEKGCFQNIVAINNAAVMNDLRVFWELDALGISEEDDEMSDKDKKLISQFESDLSFKNNRYEARLLWKSNPIELDNNFGIAKARFDRLMDKLNKDDLYQEYKEIVEDQIKNGIVEECVDKIKDVGYFLPHRAIYKPERESSRVRIIFDPSSKQENSKSLNELLLSGPNLNPNILDIILKFREHEIAFSADIEKAFLMISIAEEDRKYLRFIWFTDDSGSYKVMRMTRVPFGVTTSPFILAATIKYHIKKYANDKPKVYDMLNSSLYVDDLFYGAEDVENAYRLSSDAVTILKDASMKLHKFNSNSKELKQMWVDNGILERENNFSTQARILGLIWNSDEDKIKLDTHSLEESTANSETITKRIVLQTAARIFDPAGYISPFVIRIKMLLQQIWQKGLDWDEPLPLEIELDYRKWLNQISDLRNLSIDRKYFQNCDKFNDNTLQIFCDASLKAYGAVAYFRYTNKMNEVKTSLILSKGKVAPLKNLTLPRLELMGAVVAARMAKYLNKLFKDVFKTINFWSDSEIVLHWIKGESKNWKPFVCNRVVEIQEFSDPNSWKHCSGKENPADLLTRGFDVKSLIDCKLWWNGPEWLQYPSTEWPVQQISKTEDEKNIESRQKVLVNDCIVRKKEDLLDINKYSNLSKFLRVTAWIKRFVGKARKLPVVNGPLSAVEIQEAEKFWIRNIQMKVFPTEVRALRSSKNILMDSKIITLAPFLDENEIIRIKGRLQETEYTEDEKHPILLPSNSKFTEMMVLLEHNRSFHVGVAATLTRLRQKFWIPKGRQVVKKMIGRCLICRKYTVRPASQKTAQIPKDRVSETPPFSVTGVDFTGPVFVKIGKDVEKSYIALFTCAATRALHLELVTNLSTKNFLLAFRRFLSRRGNCRVIYSDNAKTFKSADRNLKYFFEIMKGQEIQDFMSTEGIVWKYIVELAPWWGGFYERLMKSIKEPLKKILGKAQLTFEELMTVLTEVENVLNQRPLTYVYNDISEPEPLTPAHFLLVGRKIEFPYNFSELANTVSTRKTLIKRKEYQTRLLGQTWLKWKTQYLFHLRYFHHLATPDEKKEIRVNDVVLLEGTTKSKFLWDLGRVIHVMKGRDGLVRSCVVKTKRGEFRRPVQLLYPLELQTE